MMLILYSQPYLFYLEMLKCVILILYKVYYKFHYTLVVNTYNDI